MMSMNSHFQFFFLFNQKHDFTIQLPYKVDKISFVYRARSEIMETKTVDHKSIQAYIRFLNLRGI